MPPGGPPSSSLSHPEGLAVVALMFLYVWIPRGTTVGKRLLGLRVEGTGPGRAALRALLFPVAVLWPFYGVLWLAADVLWSFVDRDGRLLHDGLMGTSVTSPSACPMSSSSR